MILYHCNVLYTSKRRIKYWLQRFLGICPPAWVLTTKLVRNSQTSHTILGVEDTQLRFVKGMSASFITRLLGGHFNPLRGVNSRPYSSLLLKDIEWVRCSRSTINQLNVFFTQIRILLAAGRVHWEPGTRSMECITSRHYYSNSTDQSGFVVLLKSNVLQTLDVLRHTYLGRIKKQVEHAVESQGAQAQVQAGIWAERLNPR